MVALTSADAESAEGNGHHIDATVVAKLNLADFQNAVPMLRELSIVNRTDVDAKDLVLAPTEI